MTLDNDIPETLATTCRRTGRRCPAAAMVARDLARAARLACAAAPDLSMTGRTRLEGCPQTCAALFVLTGECVEVFCGVEPDADPATLSAFARAFLDTERPFPRLGTLEAPPLAIVRASVGKASSVAAVAHGA